MSLLGQCPNLWFDMRALTPSWASLALWWVGKSGLKGTGLDSYSSSGPIKGEPRGNEVKRVLGVFLLDWGCVWAHKSSLQPQRMVRESFWEEKSGKPE